MQICLFTFFPVFSHMYMCRSRLGLSVICSIIVLILCVTVDMSKSTNIIISDPYQMLPGERELCVGLGWKSDY